MGTVPDSRISVKSPVVTTSEEADSFGDLLVSDHPQTQPAKDKNGNGISLSESKLRVLCLFDPNCSTVAEMPEVEHVCGHKGDTNQTAVSSPEISSKDGKISSSVPEHSSNNEPQCSNDSGEQTGMDSISVVGAADIMPTTHAAHQSLQRNLLVSIPSAQSECSIQMVDQAIVNSASQANAAQIQQTSKAPAKDILTHESTWLSSQVADCELAKTEFASKLPSDFTVPLEAESKVANNSETCPVDKTVLAQGPESLPQPLSVHTQMTHSAEMAAELAEKQKQASCKEIGTMTAQPEIWTRRDVEVQAVANVESKSVSTSPSILAAYLKENLSCEAKERQDQVCITHCDSATQKQSELAGNISGNTELTQNLTLTPNICFQTSARDNQSGKPQANTGDATERACKTSSDIAKSDHQCLESQATHKDGFKDGAIDVVIDGHGTSQIPVASPVLPNMKPVYQINIETNNQQKSCQETVGMKIEQTQPSMVQGTHHMNDAQSKQSCNTHNETGSSKIGECSTDLKPFQFRVTDELGATQSLISTDIEPKKEEKPISVHLEAEINSNMGATGGPVEEFLQVFVRQEQDGLLEEKEQLKKSSTLRLQSGTASDFNQNFVQQTPRFKKAREDRKEQRLITSAISTSEQQKLLPGKKLSPNTETKSQAKQSKRVKDVVWDEQGMTWEVYGASMDPESLGIAIQNHLQRQIREHEKLIRAQCNQNRKSISSDTSSKKLKGRQHNVFQSLLQNLRRPNCCIHPPSSSVLE